MSTTTVVRKVSPYVRAIEREACEISQKLGGLNESTRWFRLLLAGELAAALSSGQHVGDMTVRELMRQIEHVQQKAHDCLAEDFDQRVVDDE